MPRIVGAVLVAVLVAVGCASQPERSQAAPTTRAPTTTAALARPAYCRHYDDWKAGQANADRIAHQQGTDNIGEWSQDAADRWWRETERWMEAADAANRVLRIEYQAGRIKPDNSLQQGVYVTSASVREACR